MLRDFINKLFKRNKHNNDIINVIYDIPDIISNDEADEREGFVDMCFRKSGLNIVSKERLYEYNTKITNPLHWFRNKYYYKISISNKDFDISDIIDIINSRIGAIVVSNLNVHSRISFAFTVETNNDYKYLILNFVKVKERWIANSIERG